MSRGGRGFTPRGSYRGRGSNDNWNSGGSRGRGSGFTGPSRGRFNWFKDNPSGFESRKYSGSGSGDRYSSRGRGDDTGFRRFGNSRPDSNYSGRDHSHHRSPEPARKRMRPDSYVSPQASSSRRSHDGNYSGGSSDYNNRYNFSENKRGGGGGGSGYGDDRGRYRDDRRSGQSFRDRSREDYPHRKPEQIMPPPSTTRHMSSPRPRGLYRGGRASLARGSSRGMSRVLQARRNDSLLIRKRFTDSYALRKQVLVAKVNADTWRKMKIQKLRRLNLSKKDAMEKAADQASEEDPDDEVDVEKADEELEEGETVDKTEKVKKTPVKKLKVEDEEREEGEEIDDDDEEEDIDDAEELVKGDGNVQVTIKHDSDKRDVSDERHSRINKIPNFRQHFISLVCPHCRHKCITFKEYSMHLSSSKHLAAMRLQSLLHKQKLVAMRVSQRQEQRLLEESEESEGVLANHTSFCYVCKLNYRQVKRIHLMSESHRAMKKFLIPYCRVCRISFKSPMLYENHICSLEHIKRKVRMEDRMMQMKGDENASGSEADSDEKDIEKYMTLDSVGTVDAEDVDMEEDGEILKDKSDQLDDPVDKADINPGSEYLRKVEVYYCDLCKLYLPRVDQVDRAIVRHCNSRNHLQRYIHSCRDRALKRTATIIHQKESAEKKAVAQQNDENKKEEHASNGDELVGDKPASDTTEAVADVPDDKLWADVDKDLGDLIGQVVPEKVSSDEEDETDGGRYDRFRISSQKEGVASLISEGDSAIEVTVDKLEEKVKENGSKVVQIDVDVSKDVMEDIEKSAVGSTAAD